MVYGKLNFTGRWDAYNREGLYLRGLITGILSEGLISGVGGGGGQGLTSRILRYISKTVK